MRFSFSFFVVIVVILRLLSSFLGQGGDGGKGTFQFRSQGDDFDVLPLRLWWFDYFSWNVVVVVIIVELFLTPIGRQAINFFHGLDAMDRRTNVTFVVRPSFGRCEEGSFEVHP